MGYPEEGTRTYNGTAPGTFRAIPGVQLAERRLRLLMGLPATANQLIRPADEPTMAPIAFDWCSLTVEAIFRREELRRQRWLVKSRELELTASRNFLKPSLDLDARYRLRGFGHELTDSDPGEQSAYSNLLTADHQEWQAGLEFSMPLGFRQGNAAVRNAELRLSQARTVLREEERTVISGLSESVAEVDRAYALMQTDIYRTKAAKDQLAALTAVYQAKQEGFFEVLDAQRRLSEAISPLLSIARAVRPRDPQRPLRKRHAAGLLRRQPRRRRLARKGLSRRHAPRGASRAREVDRLQLRDPAGRQRRHRAQILRGAPSGATPPSAPMPPAPPANGPEPIPPPATAPLPGAASLPPRPTDSAANGAM